MSWSPSGNGSGLRRTALIAEKTAVLAPMPNARDSTTVAVNPGVFASASPRAGDDVSLHPANLKSSLASNNRPRGGWLHSEIDEEKGRMVGRSYRWCER